MKVGHSDQVLWELSWSGGMHALIKFDVTEAYGSYH